MKFKLLCFEVDLIKKSSVLAFVFGGSKRDLVDITVNESERYLPIDQLCYRECCFCPGKSCCRNDFGGMYFLLHFLLTVGIQKLSCYSWWQVMFQGSSTFFFFPMISLSARADT